MDAAISFGQKTRDAIAVCCTLLSMGVQIGNHEEFFDISDLKPNSRQDKIFIQPRDLNGLIVYPQGSKVDFLRISVSAKTGQSGERFEKAFLKAFELCEKVDDRLGLALEIYNSHYFETSVRARFLQLVTVVECLSKPQKQQKAILDHLEELIDLSEKKLTAIDDNRNFVQRLGNLKRESISSACQNLVREYLGDESVDHFKKLYDMRSKLVHEGKTSTNIDLLDHYFDLQTLVRDLLYVCRFFRP